MQHFLKIDLATCQRWKSRTNFQIHKRIGTVDFMRHLWFYGYRCKSKEKLHSNSSVRVFYLHRYRYMTTWNKGCPAALLHQLFYTPNTGGVSGTYLSPSFGGSWQRVPQTPSDMQSGQWTSLFRGSSLVRTHTLRQQIIVRGMLTTFPQCNFSPEFAELRI